MTACRTRRHFNPRSPHGERPNCKWRSQIRTYFNPRSPHGERRNHCISSTFANYISIHAPRTGSDVARLADVVARRKHFNPRSPHGERLVDNAELNQPINIFQSTLPARGATERCDCGCSQTDISIHAPRTGSDKNALMLAHQCAISIHAPRTGSDGKRGAQALSPAPFQSTLPARGATYLSMRLSNASL